MQEENDLTKSTKCWAGFRAVGMFMCGVFNVTCIHVLIASPHIQLPYEDGQKVRLLVISPLYPHENDYHIVLLLETHGFV